MATTIEIEARISALELVVLTHILQSGIPDAAFDPKVFAAARRDAWAAIGDAMCMESSPGNEDYAFTRAYGNALERLGHLLVALAEPVQEAISEIAGQSPPRPL